MNFEIVVPRHDPQQVSFFMALLTNLAVLPCLTSAAIDDETGQFTLTIHAPEQHQQDGIKIVAKTAFTDHQIVSV